MVLFQILGLGVKLTSVTILLGSVLSELTINIEFDLLYQIRVVEKHYCNK